METEQCLERLMSEYGNAILRMCYLYLKDYYLAEDATQETFIKAMKAFDSFQKRSSEKTWITRIAINCCKNMMRMRWFNDPADNLEGNETHPSQNPFEDFLEKDSISSAIMELNTNDRQIILLYYYQELSMKEIGTIIGRTENAVIQRLNRARGKLKKILLEAGYNG